jgi:hypothetical protein
LFYNFNFFTILDFSSFAQPQSKCLLLLFNVCSALFTAQQSGGSSANFFFEMDLNNKLFFQKLDDVLQDPLFPLSLSLSHSLCSSSFFPPRLVKKFSEKKKFSSKRNHKVLVVAL